MYIPVPQFTIVLEIMVGLPDEPKEIAELLLEMVNPDNTVFCPTPENPTALVPGGATREQTEAPPALTIRTSLFAT